MNNELFGRLKEFVLTHRRDFGFELKREIDLNI